MPEDEDPLLTTAQVAALIGMAPSTWRSRVHRGVAPPPDEVDETVPVERRTPRWRLSTVAHITEHKRA